MSIATMTTQEDHEETWPCCPQCNAPRQTSCPVCRTPSTDFEFADRLPEAAPIRSVHGDSSPLSDSGSDTLRLRCNVCDELFAPQFYDHCHQCGHVYHDGITTSWLESEEITPRMMFVTAALVLIFAAIVAYFGLIL